MKVGDLVEVERFADKHNSSLYIITSLAGMWSGYIVVCDTSSGRHYQFLSHFIKPLTT